MVFQNGIGSWKEETKKRERSLDSLETRKKKRKIGFRQWSLAIEREIKISRTNSFDVNVSSSSLCRLLFVWNVCCLLASVTLTTSNETVAIATIGWCYWCDFWDTTEESFNSSLNITEAGQSFWEVSYHVNLLKKIICRGWEHATFLMCRPQHIPISFSYKKMQDREKIFHQYLAKEMSHR